jgi:hypothetical protein
MAREQLTKSKGGTPPRADQGDDLPGTDIKIDPEFASLIPPLSQSELDLLEESLKQEGLRQDLVVWKEANILLDGHNRLRLCRKHGIELRVKHLSFPDRDAARAFVFRTQLARRNLTREAESYLRGKRYLDSRHQGTKSTSGQSDPKRLSEEMAQEFKVSEKTIRRDASFTTAVDAIAANCGEKSKQLILSRDQGLRRSQVIRLAKMKPKEQQEFFEELAKTGKPPRRQGPKKRTTITLPSEPKALVDTLRSKFSPSDLGQIIRLLSAIQRGGKKTK